MQAAVSLVRDPKDRVLSPAVFIKAERGPHRPVARYDRIRLQTAEHVRLARRARLPVSLLEPETIEKLGYPLSFRPRLLVPSRFVPLVETSFRVLTFADEGAARDPSLEDYIVAMLTVDALGARRIAVEHRNEIDPIRLLRRVLAEGLEARAFEVRLDEFAPGLPRISGVRPLSRTALRSEDRREFAKGPSEHSPPTRRKVSR